MPRFTNAAGCLLVCVPILACVAGCPSVPLSLCDAVRNEEARLRAAFAEFVEAENLTDEQITTLVLSEFPPEIVLVLADTPTFTVDASHPLYDTLPGEGENRESSDVLNGCWGRVEVESPYGPPADGDEPLEVTTVAALRIDLRESGFYNIQSFVLEAPEGWPCREDDRPVVRFTYFDIPEVDEVEIASTIANSLSAGVDGGVEGPTYELSLHEVAAIESAVLLNAAARLRFTVVGDHLVTAESGFDADAPAVDDLDFWYRFDCPR